MKPLTTVRLRTLLWLILPVSILGVIPYLLHHATRHASHWHGGLWQWLGVWLIINGMGLAAWCVNLFNVQGQGTPLPLDPPKRFVLAGPYRYVRNPMMLGMCVILLGEAIMYRSSVLWYYTIALMILACLFIRCWEEPDLARRFGQAYREYQQQVPRWLPRRPRRS